MTVIGIVTALEAEARLLGVARGRHEKITTLGDGTRVAISGMGPDAAARAARALLEAGATALVSWGMAGGLDPALKAGTLFLPDEVVSPEGASLPTARRWREALGAAAGAHCPVAGGKLLTSARMIGAVADKAAAFRQSGAAAVDMESMAVAQLANAHSLPFIAVRVIIDSAHDAVPGTMTAAIGPSGDLQIGRLIGALAAAPGDIAALIALGRRYRIATRALAAVARTGSLGAHAFPVALAAGTP